ncbi:uncharacterized protein FFB14_07650 [Fusarium fujikuroi]|nr:uncharacterized protein FFB14_07650 [Fusarium fujikuroi]
MAILGLMVPWIGHPLDNTPTEYQQQDFAYATLANGATLKYDCFMPTGEIYEFLPCAPWRLEAEKVLGYQRFRGTDRIMETEGPPVAQDPFVPYKLLLYKGRNNANTGYNDGHRFVYLAENKPKEPAVGDCFIRLEEIHKRMKGTETDYIDDCAVYNARQAVLQALRSKDKAEREKAAKTKQRLQRQGKWTLRFRCWTVDGKECAESERSLRDRLFHKVYAANDKYDHFDVFKVWAGKSHIHLQPGSNVRLTYLTELLRSSQGDKLGAKDFFGRYWDAVIPDDWLHVFENGFRIIVGEEWFQWFKANGGGIHLAYQNPNHRLDAKKAVLKGIERAINAPRLKFKPPLSAKSVFFVDELDPNPNDRATGWFDEGWRCLDGHPGGLYQIVVNLQVRKFLCLDTHKKPFWQEGYGYPEESDAKRLDDRHLDKCHRPSVPTKTLINTTYLNNPIKKRDPTQDRCVAKDGYSANVAMSGAFPGFYPKPAIAKKKRVAEWLHRSAFSYGGFVDGKPNNSQTANNLVLGTPDTNTVMMRQAIPRAFVKRLAIFLKNGENAVVVETAIDYSALEQAGRWMGDDDHQYTWLAANLKYCYYSIIYNDIDDTWTKGRFEVTRNLFPLNRENCLLFQSILDKSLENLYWGWNCWDANRAVVDALLESTVIDGDKEELNKEEVKEKLKQATDEDQEGSLHPQDLELVVQLNLAS